VRAEVAVLVPVGGAFTYAVPDGMHVERGSRVWVGFGEREVEGVVLSVAPGGGGRGVRPIARLVDGLALDADVLALASWIADYYMAPIGEAVRLALPPGGRATEAKRVSLTRDGERAAAGLGAALEPPELDGLKLRERALLERIHAAGGREKLAVLSRAVDGARAGARLLVERGLLEIGGDIDVRRERTEEWVRAVPASPERIAEAVGRAPRRRALLEQIAAAPAGGVPIAALRALDGAARQRVAELVEFGLCAVETRTAAPADPFVAPAAYDHGASRTPPTPTPDQARAMAAIGDALDGAGRPGGYAGFLLHGATGSGKTEVYLRAIERALARGLGALALVPEISLTPQLASRFRARFGDEVAILHSNLSDRERFDAWTRLRAGRVRIALGARSAVFAPVARLGLLIVDEEHDGSFKQEEGVRYHGRDVAMVRARDAGAVAVLGSATPSIETFEAARAGRLTLLELPGRATPRPLPTVEIIDLRRYRPDEGGLLSAPLAAAIEQTLAAGEQAILFLNRRGFSTFVLCTACGHRFACRQCAVTLTWHRGADRLACHYCGYLEPTPSRCPKCAAQAVSRLGLGTERLEHHVAERFPRARVARLDRDAAQGRNLHRVLDGVRERRIDIVVGTQMLAKGHDFPGVTLVGVVLADTGMNLPDFRASERAFQLLEQVAGRAGRGEVHGRVLIQTFNPQHPAVVRAAAHDYAGFFVEERAAREELGYPPLARLGLLRIEGEREAAVRETAERAAEAARGVAQRAPAEARLTVLGPSEAPIAKLRGRVRWQLFVKAQTARGVRAALSAALGVDAPAGVRLLADVDPVSTL
jgi:primosomal protein N' (replication factor Y)